MLTNIREFLDRLLDEQDWDTVELVNDRNEHALFDQICLIPESESVMYAILQPVDDNGNCVGEEIVFSFENADSDAVTIDVVTDQYVIRDVYTEYKRLRSTDADVDEDYDGESEEEFDEYDEEGDQEDDD